LPQNGLIVMGNEGKGISPEVEAKITRKLFIPPFHDNHVESLNISMAAAIVCNEFRRGRMS
ncbi:MAG: RNA methyltransferase, partial [Bacteroidales bacterium]|nr:RNA methyltransferase [Bacteroidales bacterium]